MEIEPKVIALVLAGGSGQRFTHAMPKQYHVIAGQTLLRRCINYFTKHSGIDAVQVVIRPEDESLYQASTKGLNLLPVVYGGITRQESSLRGLEAIASYAPTHVLIHDAARPNMTAALCDRLLHALRHHQAVVPVMPVTDSLRRFQHDIGQETVDRTDLFAIQTPQAFAYPMIFNLHRQYQGRGLTDDASLCELADVEIKSIPGEAGNIKITTLEDQDRLMGLLNYETRVGMGYDVHRFKPSSNPKTQQIMICGVPIPHEEAIEAHSDGDVGIHAIVDALLGAISQGDIGIHFPPTDPRWKDVSSDRFLVHACDLLSQAGGQIINIDVTIIAERPKLFNYRQLMQDRIAAIVGCEKERINIKATTTEKLGFLGRCEGIAAEAVVTISKLV